MSVCGYGARPGRPDVHVRSGQEYACTSRALCWLPLWRAHGGYAYSCPQAHLIANGEGGLMTVGFAGFRGIQVPQSWRRLCLWPARIESDDLLTGSALNPALPSRRSAYGGPGEPGDVGAAAPSCVDVPVTVNTAVARCTHCGRGLITAAPEPPRPASGAAVDHATRLPNGCR